MRPIRNQGWLRLLYQPPDPEDRVWPVTQGSEVDYRDKDASNRELHPPAAPAELVRICEAWLLLNHGSGYRLIRHPDQYRQRHAHSSPASSRREWPATHDVRQYDLTEIAEPRVVGDILRCYVADRVSRIPYRVELPWPVTPAGPARFQLLPPLPDGPDYI